MCCAQTMATNATCQLRPSSTVLTRGNLVKSRSVADLRHHNSSVLAFAGQNVQHITGASKAPLMRYPDEAMVPLCIPGTEIESTEFKKPKHERFQKLFCNVPSTELLVSKFSCAYVTEKGGLVQGQLYVSRNWICFYSNIFGIKKTIEIRVSSVKQIKKERTAKIFPNAIGVLVDNGQRYLFGSLISRHNTHQLLTTLLERSRIIRDYSLSVGEAPPTIDPSSPKEFVDASAGADHGYSTSMSEEESWDESDDERRPRLVNNAWTSRAAACQLHQRRLEQLHGSSDSKFPIPRTTILQRVFAMQLLVLLLIVMLLILFVYLVFSNQDTGSFHIQSACGAENDISLLDKTSAVVTQIIFSVQHVRSELIQLRDALANNVKNR